MKTTLSILCFLCTILTSFSQDKNFDLSRYKFPDYKRHELEFNVGSNGQNYHWSQVYSSPIDGTWKYIDQKNNYNNSILNLSYSFTRYTRKREEYIYSNLNSSYFFDKIVNQAGSKTSNSFQTDLSIFANERYYLTENKWFLEVNPGLSTDFGASQEKLPEQIKSKRNGHSLYLGVDLGGGIGRIEHTSDLWQAYYILKDLEKQGILSRNLEENDFFEFARTASQLKNKRFFDFRLKKIAEMKSLDSLLLKNKLITDGNVYYYSTLSDYWNFATIADRFSGKVLNILIAPLYRYQYSHEAEKNKTTKNSTEINSSINFNYSKQLNLFWDQFFRINLANITYLNNNDFGYDYPDNLLKISSSMGYSYFPNFRTKFSSSVSYMGRQFNSDINENQTRITTEWSNYLKFDNTLYYYISPQLRIEANVGINYWDKIPGNVQEKMLNTSYGFSFKYAIF